MKIIEISGHAGSGKDTAALYLQDALEARGNKVLITHFGDLVKYVASKYFDWDGRKDEKGRGVLQYVGGSFREYDEYFWAYFVGRMMHILRDRWDYVLVPDLRYLNESTIFQEFGFNTTLVRVERETESKLTDEQQKHQSETELDDFGYWHYIVKNDGDLVDMQNAMEFIAKDVIGGIVRVPFGYTLRASEMGGT